MNGVAILNLRDPSCITRLDETVVVFLVINRIVDLPSAAIESVLTNSSANIIIGYFDEKDLYDLPSSERLFYRKLVPEVNSRMPTEQKYKDFQQIEFFRLVAFKWELFIQLFDLGFNHIIYSDLDVLWISDVVTILRDFHTVAPHAKVLIQDATSDPRKPQLCMGLVSLVYSEEVRKLLTDCHSLHLSGTNNGEKIGDDDVISTYYLTAGFPIWISPLPQLSFPVGILLNAYSKKSLFPGLFASKPHIFHANYVVGERNKRLLLRVMSRVIDESNSHLKFSLEWKVLLLLKRLRYCQGNLRRKIFKIIA